MSVTIGVKIPFAGTISNLRVALSKADDVLDPYWIADATATLYINGAAATNTVTIPFPAELDPHYGYYEDTTHTDVVAADDTVEVVIALASGSVSESNAFMFLVNNISFTMAQSTLECPLLDGRSAFWLAELRRRTLRMLGEDVDGPVYWSNDEVDRNINDAYMDICRETKCLEGREALSTAIGTTEYSLDDCSMSVRRMFLDNRRLDNVTKFELDRRSSSWETRTGTPQSYVLMWENNRTIRMDITPTAVLDLDVWVVRIPCEVMSATCDVPELPEWSHLGIAYRAASYCLAKYGEQKNPELAKVYRAMSDEYSGMIQQLMAARTGERISRMGQHNNLRGAYFPYGLPNITVP